MTDTMDQRLAAFSKLLVDQKKAKIIIEPLKRSEGYWFGGGNMIEIDGTLYLSGRYRNFGDSREGLGLGERGLELAIFKSADKGVSWDKIISFGKSDLDIDGMKVLSIEGTALHKTVDGVELFLSTEKQGRTYATGLEDFQKEGTGIWSIDRISASRVTDLDPSAITAMLRCDDPRYIHVKDPFVFQTPAGDTVLGFCTHPFNWTSSNTGYMKSSGDDHPWSNPVYDHFPRGTTWDAGMARATAVVDVPPTGIFAEGPKTALLFYDGGESVRNLDEHNEAMTRPRGYACEELGGAAFLVDGDFNNVRRLSKYLPFFISPMGAGTSRYVDVLATDQGFCVTWQQSQKDYSQPLVMNFVSMDKAIRILEE